MKSKKQSQNFEIEFTPEEENEFVDKASYPSWTTLISVAIITARKHPDEITYIDVAKIETASLVENALITLAEQGDLDALRIEIRLNTLH